MAILVNRNTKAIVWGITGRQGVFHTKLMLEYGSRIVAGVTPGKSGSAIEGVPVYDSALEALEEHDANASIIFVPAPFAKDAALEAIEARMNPVVIITEGIPVHDEMIIVKVGKEKGTRIIGPNTPGIITPDECKLGIMPGHVFKRGSVGLVSRSGTLTYEIAANLTNSGLGQSTCLGMGGDPVIGLDFVETMEIFREDNETESVVMIGEIGGDAEERVAEYVLDTGFEKPVVAFIAGKTAPPGKRMGHAGAIISGSTGTAEAKIKALEEASVKVASRPSEVAKLLKK
ncbi:MAG: succinate--CoA ligase subunit alpha [Candidatus Atabeyarchaeum deiterrae]|jgi:succinyl-CoA synthetase alpha subunit